MEVKILEEKKNRLVFELPGESHTLANILKNALREDSAVSHVAYTVDHPLIGTPRFLVEAGEPRKAVIAATKRLQKLAAKIHDDAKKEL
ncbi:DNA-directed RNA polymerase subunit L [Candidatus Woesearchaeota archaeon]|nr:DNA-directed RNA polymerase subunit L [Candidatus Woesearchaeota archaeon]